MMLRFRPVARAARRQFSSKDGAPTTVTFEKMESDPRYKAGIKIDIDETYEGDRFSIKGAAIENVRPSYLDMQSTTPLDPRVLDAMLPHMMVRIRAKNIHCSDHPVHFSSNVSCRRLSPPPPSPLTSGKLWKPSLPHPLLWLVL